MVGTEAKARVVRLGGFCIPAACLSKVPQATALHQLVQTLVMETPVPAGPGSTRPSSSCSLMQSW